MEKFVYSQQSGGVRFYYYIIILPDIKYVTLLESLLDKELIFFNTLLLIARTN